MPVHAGTNGAAKPKPVVIKGFDAPHLRNDDEAVEVLSFRDVLPSDASWLTEVRRFSQF